MNYDKSRIYSIFLGFPKVDFSKIGRKYYGKVIVHGF
jgi:hypothetical protein